MSETTCLFFKNNDSITVIFEDGDTGIWKKDDPNYAGIVTLCQNGNFNPIRTLHNYTKTIMTSNEVSVTNEGNVIISSGEDSITLTPSEDNPFLSLIKTLKDKGVIDSDLEKAKPFLMNCLKNKFINGVHEIYEYCKALDFEITEDGCILAYKKVNKNYGSLHDHGKTKHALNEYTEVTSFDTNRYRHCSQGLHFCSRSYLSSYGNKNDKVIIVKINPEDIVSIPTDYNFAKGRCRKYMMVGELAPDGNLKTTDVEAATKEKIVKTAKAKETEKVIAKGNASNRIQETVQNMEIYKNDVNKVARVMNISPETVKRNLRKAKAKK